ncbi:Obg family GTPase CgtA [Bernardetia litoralis DSM 6794]|uniref:GTPase Obg n=1 Tax=Bernardetia litoralis (strain ATCC 23117 / DSM 6794 / NBRC 15988 / NCIMB 1366 / Fx l1 / Sio-4) TaxID=880071 RepID=I4AQB0_BERLS|nr:GTPase ObgE [Bernardetia litoralis]AFM06145.1 Obg family GTPase CgtA [Bernardetia litoralis DSM 6794]
MDSPNFIDYVKLFLRSGKGGAGSRHFRKEKHVPLGGPDGGDGGRGGHIIIRANSQLWTLIHLRYQKHIFAEDGGNGSGQKSTGKQGEDTILEVPLGTVVKNSETGEKVAEVMEDGDEVILVNGGRGGLGNFHFRTSVNQAPEHAQPGEPCVEDWFTLELKVLADVGLVGFPNAGKSTLLSVVSAAKPKIANYAFTTLVPNLGVVAYREHRSFVMADIPGIIEGAAEGKGLGVRFLRHIERNSMLLFVISADTKNIQVEYDILVGELEKYNPELLDKKRLLAISKSDLIDDELKTMLEPDLPKDIPHIFISAVAQMNLDTLKDKIWENLQK